MSTTAFENERWSHKPQKEEFRHTVAHELVKEGPILDVGCGDGFLMCSLTEKYTEVQGVDLSPVAISLCREKGLNASICDFTNGRLPFPDSAFGTVIALDVLEHTLTPETLLAEMKRVSSKYIIISVPNFSSLPARIQTLCGNVPENNTPHKAHVYWFNYSVLMKLASDAGLTVDIFRSNVPLERIPLVGSLMKLCARLFPNAFPLSFVVRFTI